MTTHQSGFSNVQLELLKLYANNVSERNLLEIRQLLAVYFAQKATEAMDAEWNNRNLTAEDMKQWASERKGRESSH